MNGGYNSGGIFQGIASNHNIDNNHGNANIITKDGGNGNTPMSRKGQHSHYSSRNSVKFPPISKIIGGLDQVGLSSVTNNTLQFPNLRSPQSQMPAPTVPSPTVNNYGMCSSLFWCKYEMILSVLSISRKSKGVT